MLNMSLPTAHHLNMDSSVILHVRKEEETAGSCSDVESPQLCGNSREWLRYLFLLPKELGIYETHHKHIPHSTGKLQAVHLFNLIKWLLLLIYGRVWKEVSASPAYLIQVLL